MAKRKSASNQATRGPSGPPKPQPPHKNRSTNSGSSGKVSSKAQTSSSQPLSAKPQSRTASKPPQPQVAANRSSNGAKSRGQPQPQKPKHFQPAAGVRRSPAPNSVPHSHSQKSQNQVPTSRPNSQPRQAHEKFNNKAVHASTQKSSKHQSVRSLPSVVKAPKSTSGRKKELEVRARPSKALPRTSKKTLKKSLLRQYSPTLTWRKSSTPKIVSAYSTLATPPLPLPPKNELQNKVARKTIRQNPHLFRITTPIKVNVFKKYLKGHPNPRLVKSFAHGLTSGVWPWANTNDPSFPTTYDGSHQRKPITRGDKAKFIRQQRKEEIGLGRWSKSFGKKLLPGMYSSPIGVVPKSTPGKYRLIIDQSIGPHALNSMIPRSQVKVKLDTVHDLGTVLLSVRKKYPKRKLTLFKSDVKSAYRLLPVHPLWQIKQVVTIDGQRHVDRCNTFGNRGSGWSWNVFSSLVNWIGTEKKDIPDLLGYVDDNFSWEFEGNTKYYKPYKKHFPAKQVQLLELWDELGIPHDEEKQLFGPCLPILGYEVDANKMTVKVPDEKKAKVIDLLRNSARKGETTLKEAQSLAGSVNGILTLYPHRRSGLRGLFDKMAGKDRPGTKLKVTKPVARSLSNLADYLEHVARPIPIVEKK